MGTENKYLSCIIKIPFYRFSRLDALDALEDSDSETDSIWLQIKTDCKDEIEDKVELCEQGLNE
jgi:hypothetical protein